MARSLPARKGANQSKTPGKSKPGTVTPFGKKTIALVYDFDGTLSPKPMQEYSLLPKIGVEAGAFWAETNRIAREQKADPLITYMHLMYKKAKAANIRIDRADLVALGRDVELYPGVETWFDDIAQYIAIKAESKGVELRHYMISSGLTEIIEGDRKSTRLNSSHPRLSRMPSSA